MTGRNGMDWQEQYYPETRFGGFSDVDGTVAFYGRVQALAGPGMTVLDIGCGRGAHREDPVGWRRELRQFRGKSACVIGLDPDPVANGNPYVDVFRRLLPGRPWPVDEGSVDLAFADCVLEHLEHPAEFFAEVRRVLKPGGVFAARTTNRWSYVALAARLIPNRHHARVLGKVQSGRKAEDVFPTLYRANTIPELRRQLRQAGLTGVVYGHESEPRYASFSRAAYGLAVLHQKFAPGRVKPSLFVFARREGTPAVPARRIAAGEAREAAPSAALDVL
jgi:SAM-dependent methyltransferase